MIVTGRMILAGLDVLDRLLSGGNSASPTPRGVPQSKAVSFAQTMQAVRKAQRVFALPPDPSDGTH